MGVQFGCAFKNGNALIADGGRVGNIEIATHIIGQVRNAAGEIGRLEGDLVTLPGYMHKNHRGK